MFEGWMIKPLACHIPDQIQPNLSSNSSNFQYLQLRCFKCPICAIWLPFNQLMMEAVESGEELMPRRTSPLMTPCYEKAAETPIRKISRNRGRVVPATLEVREDECGSDDNGGGIQKPALKKRNKHLL